MTFEDVLAEQVRSAVRDEVAAILADLAERPVAVNADEAARLLGVSRRQVDRWIADGLLPRVPHTASVRIPRVAIDAFALSAPTTAGEGVAARACGVSSAAAPELADRRTA